MSFLSRFGSKKSKKTSQPAAPAAPSATSPSIAPSLLLPLTLPSPSLGAPSPSPSTGTWDRVDDEKEELVLSPGGGGEVVDVKKIEADKRRLARARLSAESAKVLVELCSTVIKERGTTTLGLFRPYRLAESPSAMRQLALLFLAYVTDGSTDDPVAKDLWGAGQRGGKEGRLEAFKEELKYANVHDVVGVLKWGLRHLHYSPSFSGTTPASLAFYQTYLPAAPSPTSFSTAFLPSLPPASQAILLPLLSMIESTTAHAELNAMSSHRLTRTLGYWIFFGAAQPDAKWDEVYKSWRESGDVLEGLLKAFLRAQGVEKLPRRLKEVVGDWPTNASTLVEGRKVRVLKIQVEVKGFENDEDEDENDQETGLGAKRKRRRKPRVVLVDAFEAKIQKIDGDEEALKAWDAVVGAGKGKVGSVIADEPRRVLDLLGYGLDSAPTESEDVRPSFQFASKSNWAAGSPNLGSLSPTLSTRRRRSFSHDPVLSALSEEVPSPTSNNFNIPSYSNNFPNKSVGNLLASSMTAKRNTPNWSDFAQQGFGPTATSEFGIIAPKGMMERSKTVSSRPTGGRGKLTMPRSPSEGSVRSFNGPTMQERRPLKLATVTSVELITLDEEFPDTYLDTLSDPVCDGWPSFVLTALAPDVVAELAKQGVTVDHVLVAETLIPTVTPAGTNGGLSRSSSTRAPSIADSTVSRRWNRRMSNLFTRNKSKEGAAVVNEIGTMVNGQGSTSPTLPANIPQSPLSSPRKVKSQTSLTQAQIQVTPPPTSPTKPRRSSESGSRPIFGRRLSLSKKMSTSSLRSGENVPDVPAIPSQYENERVPSPSTITTAPSIPIPPGLAPSPLVQSTPLVPSYVPTPIPLRTSSIPPSPVRERSISDKQAAPLPQEPISPPLPPVPVNGDTEIVEQPSTLAKLASPVAVTGAALAAAGFAGIGAVAATVFDKPKDVVSSPTDGEEPVRKAEEKVTASPASRKSVELPPVSREEGDSNDVDEPVAEFVVPVVTPQAAVEESSSLTPAPLTFDAAAPPAPVEDEVVDPVIPEDVHESPVVPVVEHHEVEPQQVAANEEPESEQAPEPELLHSEPTSHNDRRESVATVTPATQVEEESAQGASPPDAEEQGDASAAKSSEPESLSSINKEVLDSPSITSEAASVTDSPTLTPGTPVRQPTLPTSPALSVDTPLSAVMSRSSTTSTSGLGSPTGSPASTSSKKFLGSSKMGELLRRKTQEEREQAKVEKLTKAQLKEAKKQEEKERKKAIPQPVSSVKKRVLEIEAEQKGSELDPTVLARLAGSVPASPTPTGPPSVVDSPRQESQHLVAKLPATSDELPSALPTPTPVTEDAATILPVLPVQEDKSASDVNPLSEGEAKSPANVPSSLTRIATDVAPSPVETTIPHTPGKQLSSPTQTLSSPNFGEESQAPTTPTPDRTFVLPDTPDMGAMSGTSTPDEDVFTASVQHATKVPALHSYSSRTSLAETTTSFATAESRESS